MGLSIHYSGRLKASELLPDLIDEVEDIAKIFGWKYEVFDTNYPNGDFSGGGDESYGILFHPHECDPLSLVFDGNGRIFAPWLKDFLSSSEDHQIKVIKIEVNLNDETLTPKFSESNELDASTQEMLYRISVKINETDTRIQERIVHLLQHIGNTYLEDFQIREDSEFLEDQSFKDMENPLDILSILINNFRTILENNPPEEGEDFEDFFRRISKLIR